MPDLDSLSSMQYLRATIHDRQTILKKHRPDIAGADVFKRYPQVEKIQLPTNWSLDEARITPLLKKRRSIRKYSSSPISLPDFAFMLWAGQGITAKNGHHLLRTTPSAGALYPIETYCAVARVDGLHPGLYHLDVENFQLECITAGDITSRIAEACLGQQFIQSAAVVFIWTAVLRRNFQKYGDRGLRYVFLDAGHVCQNTLMAVEATGGGGCPIAAFFDDELNALIGVDGREEAVLYLASAGLRK